MGIGSATDWVIIKLARRNHGYKEAEMRLWGYPICFVFSTVGYFTYGWSATAGRHWMSLAVALCLMIGQQVAQTSIATAYAMECFDGLSGELVTVLAICSSLINFAISFSVQPFIDKTNYGWAFTFFGILVALSSVAGIPMLIWAQILVGERVRSRRRCAFLHHALEAHAAALQGDTTGGVSGWSAASVPAAAAGHGEYPAALCERLDDVQPAGVRERGTGKSWRTIEVVLSTGLCGLVFAIFSVQPLTILGVTGPFSVLAENIYSLCQGSFNIPFLPFMAWSLIHAAWLLCILAIINAHDYTMRYVTTFSTEIFSLLNSIICFHKAIQELQRAKADLSFAAFLYAIIGAVGTMLLAIFLSTAESWKPLFHRYVRMGLSEYAAAISIIVFSGLPHVGDLARLDKSTLQVSSTFTPTSPDRDRFFVEFWRLPVPWIFAAIIPGMIITMLFFFDHEVSFIICTIDRYGTRKPGGFAWDVVLLGATTAVCGILGIPPANGLLPQAPLHSESLMHTETEE
ncbi:hypothetical protein KEM56_003341, partial [Ascosphaera pollenicola]